ncbi:MAG: enoyl-CoA hydratase/isomerase family protein [Deltaproteobacteria bacterium]|nr:enoyl-CoA hydratase/isomerase family protein [Deltaproteobacteria bacterium]
MKLGEAHADAALVRVRPEADAIAWIEMIDQEGQNGFSPRFVAALLAALEEVERNPKYKVAILAGTSEVFSSGATREMLDALQGGAVAPTELVLGRRLMGLRVPVIAAAEGHAIGGGFALLLAADLTVLAKESRYGANFMSLGITPGMGTTRMLEEVVGKALAHELLYTGEMKKGATLAGAGFNHVVDRARVREQAMNLAWSISEKPKKSIELLKRALSLPRRRAFEEASTIEALMHERSFQELDLGGHQGERK